MRQDWRQLKPPPGWSDWQAFVACVFPELDMQDEIDQVELGDRAWICMAGEAP